MDNLSHPSQLPSLDRILQSTLFTGLCECYGRDTVVSEVRSHLEQLRQQLVNNRPDNTKPGAPPEKLKTNDDSVISELHSQVAGMLHSQFSPSIRRLINLTGTILHTNLGRAPYPESAINAMNAVSRGACNLEYDLETGSRGRRDHHVESWICKHTGAEAATTVNNNAAAVLLTLNSIAPKRQVVVSRGELIEIGGSFRVPAIMKKASCKLREVGTTNRTHLKDYAEAIGKKTAALMKVHTSNYEIKGFTKSVAAAELAELANKHGIPLIDDLGSGTLTDLSYWGLPYERTAREAISDGADIITFSGDKLLGGPQCGIIAGRADLVRLIDKNPMKRALRLDKVTLAALEEVLKLYAQPASLAETIPTFKMLSRTSDEIKQTAQQLQIITQKKFPQLTQSVQACQSQIGSGALPTRTLDSYAVVIGGTSDISAKLLAAKFRSLSVPIIGRVGQDALWLDCRALTDDLKEVIALIDTEL